MTQEEKAKAYDEALEDMRAIYPNLKGDAKLAVEHAFPELAESEDERIRKEIINYILYKADGVSEEQEHSWIAYLEKQKEQKPAWSEEDEEHLKSIISTIEMCMRDCEDANAVLGYYDSDISWLKSLSPSWKPSEEQMNALKNSAYGTYQNGDGPVLRGLYEQLLKLGVK